MLSKSLAGQPWQTLSHTSFGVLPVGERVLYLKHTKNPEIWFVSKSLNRLDSNLKFACCDLEWYLCPWPTKAMVIFRKIKSAMSSKKHELRMKQDKNYWLIFFQLF